MRKLAPILLALLTFLGISPALVACTPGQSNAAAQQPAAPGKPAWLAGRNEPFAEVRFSNDTVVYARLALTQEQRTKGLSGTPKLEADEGMIFVYATADLNPFWMKDMLFPLDMLWINENKVVDLKANVPAPEPGQSDFSLPIYMPSAPANFVLEVNAGWAEAHGVAVGSPVQITLPPGVQ